MGSRDMIDHVRRLYEASVVRPGDYRERVHAGLEAVREALQMSTGVLVRVDDETYTVVESSSTEEGAFAPGTSGSLDTSLCGLSLERDGVLAVPRLSDSPYRDASGHRRPGFEAYVGARVMVDGEVYGTVNFVSATPRSQGFSSEDEGLVELVAAWLGTMIAVWQQSRRRRADRERFKLLAEAAFEAVVVCENERVVEANEAFSEMFGYTHDQALGRHEDDFFAGDDGVRLHGHPDTGPHSSTEVTAERRDGTTFSAQIRTRTLQGDDGVLRVTAIRDITVQKRVEAGLRHDALHDPLTGLKNRSAFTDAVQRAASRADRYPDYGFAVLFIDLDRFKSVNDRFGHAAGDELLTAIGRRIHESVREVDVAARLGGDEFVVLLDNVRDQATAYDLAVRLHGALGTPFLVDGRPFDLDCCIGIGVEAGGDRDREQRDAEHRDPERLIRDADAAMYAAKARGTGNVILFQDVMRRETIRAPLVEEQLAEEQLDEALAHNGFLLEYQPVVALDDARTVGMEALVRWPRGDGTIAAPSDFIEIAETTGHIGAIDDWVLENAVQQAARWIAEGAGDDVCMHVNLSARQFAQGSDLAGRVQALLVRHGLPAVHLALEATETALMHDPEQTIRVMHDLKDLGVRLHVDDFGTGRSNLAYLGRFPIDAVKIDGSLVGAMTNDPASQRTVRSVLSLAHGLDLDAIAEGIETPGHARLLRDLGCRYGQGFFFGRPRALAGAETVVAG